MIQNRIISIRVQKSINVLFFIIFSMGAFGQGKIISAEPSHFLFKEFNQGIILKKNGIKISSIMNYNTVTQEMIFEKSGNRIAFGNLDELDTIYLNDRVFVPREKVFQELIIDGYVSLFIQHKCELLSKGKDIGYGKSQTAVGNSITDILGSANLYNLELPEDYYVEDASIFWVQNKDDIKMIYNDKKLLKLFPDKKRELEIYMKENKLKAKKIEDLVKIVEYCNELYK